MSTIKLDINHFQRNLKVIQSSITTPTLLIIGKSEDMEISNLHSALCLKLLKYEFPELIILIDPKEKPLAIVTSKKAQILEQLNANTLNYTNNTADNSNIHIVTRNKDSSNLEEIKSKYFSNKTIGIIDIENTKGPFAEAVLKDLSLDDQTENVIMALQNKSEEEIRNIKLAGNQVGKFLSNSIELIKTDQNDNSRTTHEELSRTIEDLLYHNSSDKSDMMEFTYPPFLQSGNIFDLSNPHFNACNATYVKYENIICKIGLRYDGYNAEVGRTILFNGEEELIDDLKLLVKIQNEILLIIKTTRVVKDVLSKIQDLFFKFDIADRINQDYLYCTGLYQKENIVVERFIKNMAFVINLELKNGPKILVLTDTFLILNESEFECITRDNSLDNNYFYVFKTEKKNVGLRIKKRDQELEKGIRQAENQKHLLDKVIEEMREFYKNSQESKTKEIKEIEIPIPYKKEFQVLRRNKMSVDKKSEAVIIPIFNYCVPFHISQIKNTSISDLNTINDNDELASLRINFNTSMAITSNDNDLLKSLTYKADNNFINEINEQIKELKNEYQNKIQNKKERSEIVEQDELIEKSRKVLLSDVFIKIDAKTGIKKTKLSLELHENGFKITNFDSKIFNGNNATSNAHNQSNILFNNVKHIIYIPATLEQRAILHFNLINPILINNKKTSNIQFSKEVGSSITHDTTKFNDEYAELALEKEYEDKKKLINKEFKFFIDKVEETGLKVELPIKNFYGVPSRESVLLNMTDECITSIIEHPFILATLNEIELVSFERIVFGVRTTDIVIVNKNKTVINILSVDLENIEMIKDFLNEHNVVFMETKVNIQWPNLLKTISADPKTFYEGNSWYDLINPEVESEETEIVSSISSVESESEFDTEESLSEESEEFSGEEEEEEWDSEEEETEEEESDYDYESKKRQRK